MNLRKKCVLSQCDVAAWMGGEFGQEWICVYL